MENYESQSIFQTHPKISYSLTQDTSSESPVKLKIGIFSKDSLGKKVNKRRISNYEDVEVDKRVAFYEDLTRQSLNPSNKRQKLNSSLPLLLPQERYNSIFEPNSTLLHASENSQKDQPNKFATLEEQDYMQNEQAEKKIIKSKETEQVLNTTYSEITQLKQNLEMLEEKHQELKEERDILWSLLQQELGESENFQNSNEKHFQNLKEVIQTQNDSLDLACSYLEKTREENKKLNARVIELTLKTSQLQQQLEEFKKANIASPQDVLELKSELQQAQERISLLRKEKSVHEEQFKSQLLQMEEELKELKLFKKFAENEYSCKISELEEFSSHIATLEAQLENAEKNVHNLEHDNTQYELQIQDLEIELEAKREQVRTQQGDLVKLVEKLAHTESILTEREMEIIKQSELVVALQVERKLNYLLLKRYTSSVQEGILPQKIIFQLEQKLEEKNQEIERLQMQLKSNKVSETNIHSKETSETSNSVIPQTRQVSQSSDASRFKAPIKKISESFNSTVSKSPQNDPSKQTSENSKVNSKPSHIRRSIAKTPNRKASLPSSKKSPSGEKKNGLQSKKFSSPTLKLRSKRKLSLPVDENFQNQNSVSN